MKHVFSFVIALLCFIANLIAQVNGALPLLIPYREGNTWGYCDSNKKVIVKAQFDEPVLFYNHDLVFVSINNKKEY